MDEQQYFELRDEKNKEKLAEMLTSLPAFCEDFFRGIEPSTSSMTRLSYAYDICLFFDFIRKLKPKYSETMPNSFSLRDLEQITPWNSSVGFPSPIWNVIWNI